MGNLGGFGLGSCWLGFNRFIIEGVRKVNPWIDHPDFCNQFSDGLEWFGFMEW